MDNELFLITKVASKLNVSRQTIYNKVDELQEQLEKHIVIKDNVKYLKVEGINIIKDNIKIQTIKSKNKSSNEPKNKSNNDLNIDYKKFTENIKDLQVNYICSLQDQIKQLENQVNAQGKQLTEKDKQLDSKDELLRNFQILLKNEQENNIKLLENNTKILESKTEKITIWNKLFGTQK